MPHTVLHRSSARTRPVGGLHISKAYARRRKFVSITQGRRSTCTSWIACSTKGAQLIKEANDKFVAKDLMGALNLYEGVLKEPDLTTRQKHAALFGATAVHAAFGDVELAQITLREAIQQGIDFEQALRDPDMVDIERQTSPQILIQLRRFNTNAQGAIAKAQQSRAAAASSSSSRSSRVRGSSSTFQAALDQDPLGDILGTPQSDKASVDTSVGAIVKRVLILLTALVGLGTLLFFVGLEYMFPKY